MPERAASETKEAARAVDSRVLRPRKPLAGFAIVVALRIVGGDSIPLRGRRQAPFAEGAEGPFSASA